MSRLNKEEYLYQQFQELDEVGQINYLDRLLSQANKAKLKQKREDIGKIVTALDLKKEAEDIVNNWGMQLGLVSEFEKLNEYAGGFRRKGVYIIGGEPSSGKSTFAINLATHFDQQNLRVHVVSYEDSSSFVTARMRIILDEPDNIQVTFPAPELVEGMYAMEHNRLYEHLATVKKRQGLDVVMVDYIQFMALFAEENEYIAINNTMKLFRDIAKTLDIVLIGISQLNRGKEVKQSRFHGSGAIEKLADVAMIVDKDENQTDLYVQVLKSKFTWLRSSRIKFSYDPEKKGALLYEMGEVANDM